MKRAGRSGNEIAATVAEFSRLFSHPLRVRIALSLIDGPASATVLAGDFGNATVSDCYYHLQRLEAGDLVELTGRRPVRGAWESTFRLIPPQRLWADWRIRVLLEVLNEAVGYAGGGVDQTLLKIRTLDVDPAKFSDVMRAMEGALDSATKSKPTTASPGEESGQPRKALLALVALQSPQSDP